MTHSMIGKIYHHLRYRPLEFFSTVRASFLFVWNRPFVRLFLRPGLGINLGSNVRIQKFQRVRAELPHASVKIGAHSIVYENARIEAFGKGSIVMGESCVIGDARIYSRAKITLGNRVVTSWNVFIQDFDPHPVSPEERAAQIHNLTLSFRPRFLGSGAGAPAAKELQWEFPLSPIEIGDDVWIGANVTILRGSKIGAGSIVATGAVVTGGEYPARSIIAGVPARLVKLID